MGRTAAAPRRAGRALRRAERLRTSVRHRRGLGRGEGARALRAALRGRARGRGRARRAPCRRSNGRDLPELGRPMEFDHRRILATALGPLARQAEIPAGGVRAVAAGVHPLRPADRPSRRSPARCCTSRISGGWSSKAASSRPPAMSRPRPAGAPPGSIASAARWCWSAPRRVCGSRPAAGNRLKRVRARRRGSRVSPPRPDRTSRECRE